MDEWMDEWMDALGGLHEWMVKSNCAEMNPHMQHVNVRTLPLPADRTAASGESFSTLACMARTLMVVWISRAIRSSSSAAGPAIAACAMCGSCQASQGA